MTGVSKSAEWASLNPKPMGDTDKLVDQDKVDEYYREREKSRYCSVGKRACDLFSTCVNDSLNNNGMSSEDALAFVRDECEFGFDIPETELPGVYECGVERAGEMQFEQWIGSKEREEIDAET